MEAAATVRDELRERILELKRSLNAVIMAHNYQIPEVQEIADITGDSLELAREVTRMECEVIVMCGVRFMAESAAILNPSRTVLLGEGSAGCPMADMISADDLRQWKQRYRGATVVCYVNTSAAVKAESDYCCTSANASRVVEAVPNDEILFVPDMNLGHYVSTKTSKRIILYPGYCSVHHRLTAKHVMKARREFPDAVVMVHPECRPEVIEQADAALSTSQMLRYAGESSAKTFLVGTEEGLVYRLRKDNPGKTFHIISRSLVCSEMKKTTLDEIVQTMEQMRNVVDVPEEVRLAAKRALDRMLSVV